MYRVTVVKNTHMHTKRCRNKNTSVKKKCPHTKQGQKVFLIRSDLLTVTLQPKTSLSLTRRRNSLLSTSSLMFLFSQLSSFADFEV